MISFYDFNSIDFTDDVIQNTSFQEGLKMVIRDIADLNQNDDCKHRSPDMSFDPMTGSLPSMLPMCIFDEMEEKDIISRATDMHQPE